MSKLTDLFLKIVPEVSEPLEYTDKTKAILTKIGVLQFRPYVAVIDEFPEFFGNMSEKIFDGEKQTGQEFIFQKNGR